MGFKIFASSGGVFNYVKEKNLDGKTFDAVKLINTLAYMDKTKAGAVEGAISEAEPDLADLYVAVATLTNIHLLKMAVDNLAIKANTNKASAFISVQATETHLLSPDESFFARYNFPENFSHGKEFIEKIAGCLVNADLNNFAVLGQMAIVISKYHKIIKENAVPMLNIHISH